MTRKRLTTLRERERHRREFWVRIGVIMGCLAITLAAICTLTLIAFLRA